MSESIPTPTPKNFMAFLGKAYYPSGGMNDHVGDFNDLDTAIKAIVENAKKDSYHPETPWEDMWAHIWDVEKQEVIWDHYELEKNDGYVDHP